MLEYFIANLINLIPLGYAFGAGIITMFSPCSVAMLPSYMSLYLSSKEDALIRGSFLKRLGKAILLSLLMTTGLLLFFTAIGVLVSLSGRLILYLIPWFSVTIGISLTLLGIWLLAGGHFYYIYFTRLANNMGKLTKRRHLNFLFFGIVYGITAFSCTLPVFMVVVGGALAAPNFIAGILQFLSYALGMGVILFIVTVGTTYFKEIFYRKLMDMASLVSRLSGALLIVSGAYIIYYWFKVGGILNWGGK